MTDPDHRDLAAPPGVVQDCDCPADPRIARYFDRRAAMRRTSGERFTMGAVSKTLLGALQDARPAGHSILELGCGPGALLTELLTSGAGSATGLDLSAEALREARERTIEAGVGDRATFANADGARAELRPHDWVVLDKVICCYPDPEALLENAIPAAQRLFAFALPESTGWRGALARIALGIENTVLGVLRRPCPGYVHDVPAIERRLQGAGFDRTFRTSTTVWYVAVFQRRADSGSAAVAAASGAGSSP
jgi:magnesium-protoporphyrin O-methyltransferase